MSAVNGAIPAEELRQSLERIRRTPSHPGCLLRDSPAVQALSVREAAARLGVGRDLCARVLKGWEPVTPDLAARIEAAGWARAELWLRLQATYDQALARRSRAAPAPLDIRSGEHRQAEEDQTVDTLEMAGG